MDQIIENVQGNYLELRGQQKPVLNASSFDFYGFSRSLCVKKASSAALDVYGCGSCGPRGFYGTIDQHLKIEHAIADFMGTEVGQAARCTFVFLILFFRKQFHIQTAHQQSRRRFLRLAKRETCSLLTMLVGSQY